MQYDPLSTRMPGVPLNVGTWLLVSTLVTGCGAGSGRERNFQAARTLDAEGTQVRWGATSAERFGISAQDFAERPAGGSLHWTTPDTWVELPGAQFRLANFQVAGEQRAECYLTTLSGDGGGLTANVNRWRSQLSREPLTDAEIAALPRQPWLGRESVLVDFTGTWTGMSGEESAPDWRLVGLLSVDPAGSSFLKMTGPVSLLERELSRFHALAASFHDDASGHGHAEEHEHEEEAAASAPPAGPAEVGLAEVGTPTDSPAGLQWTPPEGWELGPEKAMREITYLVEDAECYVTLLAGDGGGLVANVNRWCQQMGQPPLTAAEVERLERVPMLDDSGVLIDLLRGEGATATQERMLGVVLVQDGQALFVKMAGRSELLERERDAFLRFCRSARRAG